MPMVDLVDETFIVASPASLSARLHDPTLWRRWWPRLELVVFRDRGEKGLRWTVTGEFVGTSEIWVEPWGDGAIVHYYLRADITRRGSRTEPITGCPRRLARRALAANRRHVRAVKRSVNRLKDEFEAGREVGTPRVVTAGPVL